VFGGFCKDEDADDDVDTEMDGEGGFLCSL